MGYLGKISALVTANTGDFSRNLNAAASDVRKFAASVQNNITKASSDAERSFKAIYTPLQTLERSLKAASSMKLSFKGFDGAIRDVNVLKERLTSLKGTQVDLILKASGLQTISEFRDAIKDISNESFNFAIKFGGIDKLKLIREELRGVSSTSINAVLSAGGLERLKELKETISGLKGDQLTLALRVGGTETLTKVEQQAAGLTQKDMKLLLKVGGTESLDRITEELAGVSSRSIDALVNVKGTAELDRVLEMFQNLAPEQIEAVIKTVGAQDLEAAVTKMQQLRSAAILVGEPLAAAAQKFSKLSIDAQAGFVAALNVSQTKVQELKQDIDDGVTIGTTLFKALEAQVLKTAEAIDRLGEAEALVGQVGNGRSFQFQRPLDREALVKSSEVRAAALKLPGQALADNPEIANLQNRISGLASQYPRLQANLEAAKEAGADYSQQITAIEKWRSHLLRLISDQEKQIATSSAQGQATALPRFRGERSFIGDRIAAQRAAQEEAMFGERAAETDAERAAAARQRRARRETFADSLTSIPRQPQARFFGGDSAPVPSLEGALARTAELDAAYGRLSQNARSSLQAQARELDGIARAANQGAAGVSVLADANDRMAAAIAAVANAAEREAAPLINRAKAEREFYEESRRLREQAAADSKAIAERDAAPLINRAKAEREFEVENKRLRDIPAAERREAGISGSSNDAIRQVDVLRSRTNSLNSQIDQLSAPFRNEMIPAIRAAENELIRLSSAVNPVPEQIEQAAANLRDLENTARRLSAIDAFGKNFGNMDEFLSGARVREFSGEMEALRGVVARARPSRERDGAARAAERLQRVRSAQLQLDEDERVSGLTFPDQRADLERRSRRAELVADARAGRAADVSARSVRDRRRRGGDVGRGGADNASLALNQLAFAVDDFMSSTGGLEFKLRAISNNITQMAFVLGGTTGLFVGLGAVMVGQVAVGLLKWINNGKTAEDQTRSLNDALAQQKTLASEVADAFRSLGDALAGDAFSKAAADQRAFLSSLDDIRDKQGSLRDAQLGSLTPAVQSERALQNALGNSLEKESNPIRRVGLQMKINESQGREAAAMAAARANPVSVAELLPRLSASSQNRVRDAQAQAEKGFGVDVNRAMRGAVSDDIAFFEKMGGQENTVAGLKSLLMRLEDPVQRAIDALARDIVAASRDPSEQIKQAQQEVAEAIRLGIPGARLFQLELDENARRLAEAYKNLEAAKEGNKDERLVLIRQAEAKVNEARAEQSAVAEKSDALRFERTVDPQRQIEARMARASGNLSAAGLEDGRIARRMREIENDRETIRQMSTKDEFQNPMSQRLFEESEAALNAEVAAIEAATIAIKIFADALNRASEEAKGNLNSAQQAADEARRADLGNSTPQTQEARRQAEADLERQREIERQAQTEIAVERDRLEQMQRPEAERLQQIDEELKSGREIDQGLVDQRGRAEADATAAEESRQKFANVVDAQKAFGDATEAQLQAEEELGITGTPDERDKQLKDSGRGDLVKGVDVAWAQMHKAEKAVGLEEADYSDAIVIARNELAAAIERQSQAANALAEIDEKIAAGGMSGDREDLIREREALKAKMEDDARTSQARIDAARDASTQEEEQRKAGIRGRELTRTPEERFKAETDQGLADIQAYFERRAEENGGLRPAGDAELQAAAEDRFRKDREKEARTATAEGRGRELGMTPEERFRRDMEEGPVADLTAAAKEMQAKGQDPTALLRQGIQNQMESVAPMLTQFQEERENAILQGPSRAALNVSDITTTQGASELTRLLRGDDAAKDVNLAELSKQTGKLQEIVDQLKANNPEVLL